MPDLPPPLWILFAGILGLLVGSFLNVVILRLPARMDWAWRNEARKLLDDAHDGDAPPPPGLVREPSHCMHCKHRLSAFDNMPLFGWLLLRGRCRYCKARISIQYPLVELASAVASAVVIWHVGVTWAGAAGLIFTWMLIALAGIDLRVQLLPDQLTYPLLWLGLLLSLVPLQVDPVHAILGAVIGYMALWSLYWLFKLATGKEGMGYGDFKLLAALGAWMGPLALLPIALMSALVGLLVSIPLLAIQRRDVMATQIPFGVYLAPAGWIWFVFGPTIWSAYAHMAGLQ